MKRVKFNPKLVTNRQWYHQRFDGCPMFIGGIAEAELRKEARKPRGAEAFVRVCYFSHGKGDWYLDVADIKRGAQTIIRLAKKNPQISGKLLKSWREDERKFENFFWSEFPKIHLKNLTLNQLLALWYRYWALFLNRVTSSSVIDHFALGTDEIIGRMIRKEVEAKKRITKESEFSEIFSAATAPVHQSFINEAEIELLKIILKKSNLTSSEYQKKYFWTKNNYVLAQELDIAHIKQEIQAWKMSGKDLNEEIRRIEATPKKNHLQKLRLFKKFNFSKLLGTLLKISEDFTWWQDERKKSTYFNIHIGTKILAEIGRRTGYSLEELKYVYSPELTGVVNYGNPKRRILEERKKSSVFVFTEKTFSADTGRKVKKVRDLMFSKKNYDQIRDIRGLTANLGKAVGPVKIVKSSTEVGKVKIGDIVIAVMTRPDYIVAMKKAAAIVTDEGGVTSHAAIVARELGIPCLIGTKIATQVFKDGDLVEVNASHGWVRKIQG